MFIEFCYNPATILRSRHLINMRKRAIGVLRGLGTRLTRCTAILVLTPLLKYEGSQGRNLCNNSKLGCQIGFKTNCNIKFSWLRINYMYFSRKPGINFERSVAVQVYVGDLEVQYIFYSD